MDLSSRVKGLGSKIQALPVEVEPYDHLGKP